MTIGEPRRGSGWSGAEVRVPFVCVLLAEVMGAVALVAQHDRGAVVLEA